LNSMQSFMNAELIDAVKRNDDLQALGKDKKRVVTNLSQQYRNWEKKSEAVQKQVQVLQAAPNEVEGDKKSRLIQMQQKLIEIEENKANIRAELEGISKEIAQNKKMQQSFGQDVTNVPMIEDFIAVDDLINLETKLDELEKSHGILREVNPISAQAIEEYMANYKKAQQALLDHNTAIKLIASGTFKPKLTGLNPFSGLYDKFSKGEVKEDDHTSQFLTRLGEIRESFNTSVMAAGQEKDLEKSVKRLEELNALETLTEEQIAEKAEIEKLITQLSPKGEEIIEEKDDTPKRENKNKQKVDELTIKIKALEEELKNTPKNITVEGTQSDIEKRKGLNGAEEIIFSNPNFKLEGFEIDNNYWNVVTSTDRAKVLININGTIVPFYLTTGQAGKGLIPGWYPFFGIGKDGWLNKTDKSDMETYYERYWGKETADIVKSISEELNSVVSL